MLVQFALFVALGWALLKALDSLPLVSKPLQLIGLVVVGGWLWKHRDAIWPHVKGAADEVRNALTPPPAAPQSSESEKSEHRA